ncbi:MAG: hypothetical protein ACK4YQ_02525 [Phenylobacterium sp.]|uniref:hypothetical protein n=1 Tax=Phenylobacterium sp. TaxID=1871053 RepID=UPI00391A2391
MRSVVASLIVLAGLSSAAVAQPTAETPPPAAPEAPAAPPAAPAAAPAPDAAAPQAPAAAPADDPAAHPTLPTTGDGAEVISVINNICVPSVRGKTVEEVAKPLGFKFNRRENTWSKVMGSKPYEITVLPKGSNTNVCNVRVKYAVGQERPIVNALNIWAFLHQPEMPMQRNDFMVGADGVKRITLSWEYFTDKESTGLVLVQLKNPDDSPLDKKFDQATILYSERTL